MVRVKRLIELLQQCPHDAMVSAYEGEDLGILIRADGKGSWWIRASYEDSEDVYIEGFTQEPPR